MISGKSQRIIEEAGCLTPPAFHILFTVSSRVFAVEQFELWRWKADKKTNIMILDSVTLPLLLFRHASKYKCYTTRARILRQVLQS